ncbi:phosphatidylethanolamine-binding protein PEBP [Pseudohyphozyma bogoriensis]|nr:phosphatidylethanolamine-binding protein PEBP [Pseudohyphozyma bogoriensis]
MLTSSKLVLVSLVALAAAQIPANTTQSQLSVVDAEYVNSGFASQSLTGFGVSLTSTVLLTVSYDDSFGPVVDGTAYTADQVANLPSIHVTPLTASDFTSTEQYTVTLADAASLGDPDVEGNYRHFLANSMTGAPTSGSSNVTFTPSGGTTITYYAGPGPIAGTGPHRYAWLLFSQSSTFTAPSNLSTAGTSASHWNVSSYVQETGLTLIAATFFTVENGTPTGSVVATSAVNTAAIASSAGSSSTVTSAPTSTSGSTSAQATATSSTTTSGAGKVVASVAGGLFAVASMVFLL